MNDPAIVRYRGPILALLSLAFVLDVFAMIGWAVAGDVVRTSVFVVAGALVYALLGAVKDYRP